MTIEIQTPVGAVHEWVIRDIEKHLAQLRHKDRNISRAQVYFRKQTIAFDGDYVCEIELSILNNTIMVKKNADSFGHAANKVVEELNSLVDEELRKQREPQDAIISSVRA